ncbi:hypothetical protein AAC387_Pa07g2138 [Persea americana]
MLLSLLNMKSYMELHPATNRQSCFKHQILSESNKNCKILQNSQKKEETVPAKKQKTFPQCVAAPTPKAVTKNPEARGNPAKPQPAENQVCPKTWSPRSSPKQRRSRTSAKPAYLAPLKENLLYPLAYVKGEKPTLHRTTKPTQHKPACSYKPKIKSCITRPQQEPAKACSPVTRPFISTGAELAKFKASLGQVKDHVQILSMLVFKEDKLGCCARGTTSLIARAQPELTEAQIARRIRRRAAYRQKRLEKQRTQHSELQVSQKWVEKEAPNQVAAVHMAGKSKRRQKSATKIHVRRPVTHNVSRMRRHQEDSPTPSSHGHQTARARRTENRGLDGKPPSHSPVSTNNDEVPPQDEANGGGDESRALTKKDVDNILAKAKEEDTLKEHGIKSPYPLWMDSVPFLPKFKQPLLQTYTGKGSARQYVIHFKILTGTIADQDALKIRLFAGTLKGTAFDWYSTLPEDSIQNWTMLETRFLTHFKGEDHPITMAQLYSLKHGENESTYDFIHKWKAMAYKCSDVLPQASLVDICRNNMRARIHSMIIGNKSKNLGELLEASMEAEMVIKDLNSQKSSKKEPTAIPTSKPKKKEVLNVQTKLAPQPPKKAGNKAAGKRPELSDAFKERVEKKHPFDEDVEEIFEALLANRKLTLPDPKRAGDVGKINDPRYCPYHQMVSHPFNQCFVVREKINEMWKNGVITFDKNYRSASVNMVSYGQTSKSLKEKITTSFKVIKMTQTSQELVPYPTLEGQPIWVHPDLLEDENWEIVKTKLTAQQ